MVDNQKKINFTKMHGCKNDYLLLGISKIHPLYMG